MYVLGYLHHNHFKRPHPLISHSITQDGLAYCPSLANHIPAESDLGTFELPRCCDVMKRRAHEHVVPSATITAFITYPITLTFNHIRL